MVKICTKCHRKWQVSIYDNQEYYVCPVCERRKRYVNADSDGRQG